MKYLEWREEWLLALKVFVSVGNRLHYLGIVLVILLLQDGTSPLFIASQRGYSPVVNILLKYGANINLPKNVHAYTYTWLHYCVL